MSWKTNRNTGKPFNRVNMPSSLEGIKTTHSCRRCGVDLYWSKPFCMKCIEVIRKERKTRTEWRKAHPHIPDIPEDRKARRERALSEISEKVSVDVVDGGVDYALKTKSGKTVAVWTSWDKAREELRRRVQKAEVFGNRDFVVLAEVANEAETPTKFWVMTNGEMQRLANLEGDSSNISEPPVEWRDRWNLLQ